MIVWHAAAALRDLSPAAVAILSADTLVAKDAVEQAARGASRKTLVHLLQRIGIGDLADLRGRRRGRCDGHRRWRCGRLNRGVTSTGGLRGFAFARFTGSTFVAGTGVDSSIGIAPVMVGGRVSATFFGDKPGGTTDTVFDIEPGATAAGWSATCGASDWRLFWIWRAM